MTTALVYLYPLDDRATFRPFAERWVASYLKYYAGAVHNLTIAFVNGAPSNEDYALADSVRAWTIKIQSTGIDCGANQAVAKVVEADFIVCGTSRHYYHRPDYLKRLVEARKKYGRGLYGAVGSYERNPVDPEKFPNPHLRTVFYGLDVADFRKYPLTITSRHEAHHFEAGKTSLTNWFLDRGLPVKMVTFDGEYDVQDWRNPKLQNIFRRGDQSEILVHDKHSDIYRDAAPEQQRAMARAAGDLC